MRKIKGLFHVTASNKKRLLISGIFFGVVAGGIVFFQACSPFRAKQAALPSAQGSGPSGGSTSTTLSSSSTTSLTTTSSVTSTTQQDDCHSTKKIGVFDFYYSASGGFPQTKRLYDEYDPNHEKILVFSYNSAQPSDIPSLFSRFMSDLASHPEVDQNHLFVSGYSGGATMATLMGLENARQFAGVVYITQGVQYPDEISAEVHAASRKIPFFIIDDPTRQGWYMMKQILNANGYVENQDFQILKIDGLGHNIPSAAAVPSLFEWMRKTRLNMVCP